MTPHYQDDTVTLYAGDCLEVLAELEDASVDSVVTDPPYGLEFMGREWDKFGATVETALEGQDKSHPFRDGTQRVRFGTAPGKPFQDWCEQWAAECLRVLKPGGHMLAFGGTRTWHRLAAAIEDAGFEIRDSIAWLYGSGFPKSLDVSKAIDKAAGVEFSERPAEGVGFMRPDGRNGYNVTKNRLDRKGDSTPDAQRWQGWGTALKPAFEPIVVARKPLTGTVATNVLTHGTGALNIAATRVGLRDSDESTSGGNSVCTCPSREGDRTSHTLNTLRQGSSGAEHADCSDLPASATSHALSCPQSVGSQAGCQSLPCSCGEHAQSVVEDAQASVPRSDDAPEPLVPGGAGIHSLHCQSNSCTNRTATNVEGRWPANVILDESQAAALDTMSGIQRDGVAVNRNKDGSRYDASSYVFGIDKAPDAGYGGSGGASRFFYTAKAPQHERPKHDGIAHPTVKPLDLMRWLVRLVTPPGGVVLDPFAGSGTTAEACIVEGFRCITIEREPDYLPLIVQRLTKPIQVTLI